MISKASSFGVEVCDEPGHGDGKRKVVPDSNKVLGHSFVFLSGHDAGYGFVDFYGACLRWFVALCRAGRTELDALLLEEGGEQLLLARAFWNLEHQNVVAVLGIDDQKAGDHAILQSWSSKRMTNSAPSYSSMR